MTRNTKQILIKLKSAGLFLILLALSCVIVPTTHAEERTVYPARVYYFSNLGNGGSVSINSDLNSMGYSSSRYYNYAAQTIRNNMGDLAVFAYIGHGLPGRLSCTGTSQISAKSVSGESTNYSLQNYYANTTSKLKKNRLIYYGSCYSDDYDSTYGRLTTYSAGDLSARSVIGYSGSVNDVITTYFEERLFSYLNQTYTVQTAINLAKADTEAAYGTASFASSNVDTASVYGYGASYVKPARFGE